jgi:hypothetical protein
MMLESGNTFGMFVRMIEAVVTTMGKTLVPEEPISANQELVHVVLALDGGGSVRRIRDK